MIWSDLERSGPIRSDPKRYGAIWSNLERSVTLWKDLERETFTDNVDFDMTFTDFLKNTKS